jgi:protein ImuB
MSLVCCLVSDAPNRAVLDAIARACSPRVELHGDDAVIFDAGGLARIFGTPEDIAGEVMRLAGAHGMRLRVALAGTTSAAWILAHAQSGVTIVAPGEEAEALRAVPLKWLTTIAGQRPRAPGSSEHPGPEALDLVSDLLSILARWGLHTLGDLARLPRGDVRARLGPLGVRLHQAACGEAVDVFVPAGEPVRFLERIDLEWPIDGLEPLSFVLARLCESLSASLEPADRGAVVVTSRLQLVTRVSHERTLHLPAPIRDARVLRTLILLDLESHPPAAAIDRVEVEAGVAPGAIVQGSLLRRALPTSEDVATLVARLGALMGESRVGAPALVDTHDDRVVAMTAFHVMSQGKGQRAEDKGQRTEGSEPSGTSGNLREPPGTPAVLRRFRLPLAARVALDRGAPIRVDPAARGLAGGRVLACAGPWRSSGRWWALDRTDWDREEWDVELADGGAYRLSRDRATKQWVVEGVVD